MSAEWWPATVAQSQLWLSDRRIGGAGYLAVPLVLRLRGPLDRVALDRALADLVERHEGLRTVFAFQAGLMSRIRPAHPVVVERPGGSVTEFVRDDTDITAGCLRVGLWPLGPTDHRLVLAVNHLVTDGWSNRLLARDLSRFYDARVSGEQADLSAPGWSFHRYAGWLSERLTGERLAAHQAFWRNELRGARGLRLGHPTVPGRRRPPTRQESFTLDATVGAALREVARTERTTLFVVLFALYLRTLHSQYAQPDLTVTTLFANRAVRATQETVGYFATMAPIRAAAGTVRDLIARLRRTVLSTLAHQELPFPLVPRDTVDTAWPAPLTSAAFQMLAGPARAPGFAGLEVEDEFIPDGLTSRFDLELLVRDPPPGDDGSVRCVLRYADGALSPGAVAALIGRYRSAATDLLAVTA